MHAQRLPRPLSRELVEALAGEMLGEVSEDEGCSIGVLDGLARRTVQGLVKDSITNVLWVRAIEVLELGSQWNTGRMDQQLTDGYTPERVAVGFGPEGAEWDVEIEFAFLPEGTDRGPHRKDFRQAGGIENGVRPHRHTWVIGVEHAGGAGGVDADSVTDGPYGAWVDLVADAFAQELFDAVGAVRHGLPVRRVHTAGSA